MIRRYLMHMPHGALAAILLATPGLQWAGVGWTALIIAYQFIEDWRIKDESYIDVRGYMIGFALVVVPALAWRLL